MFGRLKGLVMAGALLTLSLTQTATAAAAAQPLTIDSGSYICTHTVYDLGSGNVGAFFAGSVTSVSGHGPTPYAWSIVSGTLPHLWGRRCAPGAPHGASRLRARAITTPCGRPTAGRSLAEPVRCRSTVARRRRFRGPTRDRARPERTRRTEHASPTPPSGRSSLRRPMVPRIGCLSPAGSRPQGSGPYGRRRVIGSPSQVRHIQWGRMGSARIRSAWSTWRAER